MMNLVEQQVEVFVLQRLVKVSSLLKNLKEVELPGAAFQMGPTLITIIGDLSSYF